MDRDYFIYNIRKNKDKLILFGSIVLLIIVCLITSFVIFKKDVFKPSTEDNTTSSKYVLADNIVDVNKEGEIVLYNSSNGKTVDSLSLDGSFLIDMSDDFKELYLLNNLTKELHTISVKNSKIKDTVTTLDIEESLDDFISFDYDNGNIALLNNNKKNFIVKANNSTVKEIQNDTEYDVDNYRIVENNLIFTSGEYICSSNILSNGDNTNLKIHIGEKSSYIHEVSDKVFIHNNFGMDRGISILLDINPSTLYINDVHKYNVPTNTFASNINDTRLYFNEIITSELENKQMIKYSYIDDFSENGAYSIESNDILSNSNSYGSLGYVYYKNNDKINVFNIKSNEIDLIIDLKGDFFAPIYE